MRNTRIPHSSFADGCLSWIGTVALILIGIVWLLQNHPALVWVPVVVLILFFALKKIISATKTKKREQNYTNRITEEISKWKNWENDGIPTQKIPGVFLEDDEESLVAKPFHLRVGNANRTSIGTLVITSKQVIFASKTATKRIPYKDIFQVEHENNRLFFILKKSDKNLCVWSAEQFEENARISLAEVFIAVSYCMGASYSSMEHDILKILGVQKQNK